MKSFRATWCFGILVVLIVSYAYFFEYKSSLQKSEQEESAKRIAVFHPDEIYEVILKKGPQEILIQKSSEGWMLLKPNTDHADPAKVDFFLQEIRNQKKLTVVGERGNLNLKGFGLEHPRGEIVLKTHQGQVFKYQVGTRKNFNGDSYLSDGKEVWLVSSAWDSLLDKKFKDFRNLKIFTLQDEIQEIRIRHGWVGHLSVHLQQENGQWTMPDNSRALDQEAIQKYVHDLKNIEMSEIVSEKVESFYRVKEWGVITLSVKTESGLWTLRGGKDGDGKIYFTSSDKPFVFQLQEKDFKDLIHKEPIHFLDRVFPFQVNVAGLTKIFWSDSSQEMLIIKQGTKWHYLKDQNIIVSAVVDTLEVSNFLRGLSQMKVSVFLEEQNEKNFSKTFKKIFLYDGDKEVLSVIIGRKIKKKIFGEEKYFYYVKSSLFSEHLLVSEFDIEVLPFYRLVKEKDHAYD